MGTMPARQSDLAAKFALMIDFISVFSPVKSLLSADCVNRSIAERKEARSGHAGSARGLNAIQGACAMVQFLQIY